MTTKAQRSEAARALGRQGKGAAKVRGDAAHYAALRLKREGTVTIEDMRSAAAILRTSAAIPETVLVSLGFLRHPAALTLRVAAWLEREADRRERINREREAARMKARR